MAGERSKMKLLVDISEEYYEILQKMPDDEMTGTMYAIKYGEKPCEDAISRQAAISAILTEYTDCERNSMYSFTAAGIKQTCADLLSDLPPVIPSRPTGHWVRVSMDKYVQHAMAFYRCSECDSDIIGTHNYCPNCGCRMKSEEQT